MSSEHCQTFFDIFNDFKTDSGSDTVLREAKVRRISTNRSRDKIRLYLDFSTLVPKYRIKHFEEELKRQYFSGGDTSVYIIESFHLREDFSAEAIFENYRDSIYDELDSYSSIIFNIFKRATLTFEGDESMYVALEDTSIARSYSQELNEFLNRIFCERLGRSIDIEFTWKDPKKSEYIKDSDEFIKSRINQIIQNKEQAASSGESEYMELPKEKKDRTKPEQKRPEKTGEIKKERQPEKKRFGLIRSKNPDVLFGREFPSSPMKIIDIEDELGEVTVAGEIIDMEVLVFHSGKCMVKFAVTDDTDSISVKLFMDADQSKELKLKKGDFVRVCGLAQPDKYGHDIGIISVRGIMKYSDFREHRMDHSRTKRVELHAHTKMSDMDGVAEVGDIIKRAKEWGHRALAVTDNGGVQAYPDAAHSCGGDFQVIYGLEANIVEDTKAIAMDSKGQKLDEDAFVVFDLETTGLNARKAKIIEIGAVRFERGVITDRFSEFVNPNIPIPYKITELTGITDEMVSSAGSIEEILPRFREFCGDAVLVAHNADFDTGCVKAQCSYLNIDWEFTYIDTIPMSKLLLKNMFYFGLDKVAKALDVPLDNHHRAVDDAECTALIFDKLCVMLSDRGIYDIDAMNDAGQMSADDIRKERPTHCTLLAKNDLGRVNLYRMVSESHLYYFGRIKPMVPKVPKSLLLKCREGILIGSGDSGGALYQAILQGKSDEEVMRVASLFDFLEVQPAMQNASYLSNDRYGTESVEDLQEINRRIVSLGEELDIPVCATGDVHFLDPRDEIYRRILQVEQKVRGGEEQPPLYLYTTDEMLKEFSYLGEGKAEEIVIKNTNLIADMCEPIEPTRPDKCPPVIENSDKELRKICFTKAHEVYGEDLPEIVEERLERELNSIISNGYAVMYIIAQKLVWKSVEDGYLVGSRGSVGSSFVATMAGITEVNPLSPHYICPACHYTDFDSDQVKEYAGRAGCDMPDAVCPDCGTPLIKEGFDIPFETFLGFKGNKEPDIDLNFSGDYQNKAHKYTEIIFGEGQTFRAGTIGTLADKTAYGFIRHYYHEKGESKRGCEINRIVSGCVGVKRTTGQHPGGIIVLPMGESIYSFTPVQHPANKDTDIITTHFDYHSIDTNLLKLDILGHDDPTMIRMLEDLTSLDATKIRFDDKSVMSLFMGTEPLGVTPDDLWGGTLMGTLGVPEFGTDFAMGMLRDAAPTEFSDLVRIAGLAHGTDVWLGNAQDLIADGIATISTAICTRDDIMTYLINKGMDSEESFNIMERVRKGAVAKGKCAEWPDWKEDMKAHGVPDWYIGSCEKIKYMFPKAHAAAYVMMAWRIAWFKIHEPLAYYAAYFSIRTKFDYEKMCRGKSHLERELSLLKQKEEELKKEKKNQKLTANEKNLYMDMRSVQEMYARGFEFLPIDLYESDARYFKIKDGKLLPPFTALDGMGETAAESLAEAAAGGRFLSKEDISERAKVNGTIIDLMARLGILGNLPETNQLSLFDNL